MIKTIAELKGKEILFLATHVVEFFPAPLPNDLDGESVSSKFDLFRTSHAYDYNEIFLADGKTINGECEGKSYQFAIEDFLRWQLERVNVGTLWQLIATTDASVTEILDGDTEYEKDPDYNPEDWLNVYRKNEHLGQAESYIRRLRQEVAHEFYGALIQSILGDNYGLLNTTWYETEIHENLDDVRSSYAEWNVSLTIVSTGKFLPYICTDNDHNLMMDDYKIYHMYVRNYDEGDRS